MSSPSGLQKRTSVWFLVVVLTVWQAEGQSTQPPSVSCPAPQLLCGGSTCYNPTTQYCSQVGSVIQCIAVCGSQCYNSSVQQCFNGTLCSLNQQLCTVRYMAGYSYQYNPPFASCYDPKYQACLNNTLCTYPYQVCNGQCMGPGQACADNVTVCNVTNYGSGVSMKLCNGVCYNSAVQQCVGGYTVNCIRDPSTQQCINQTTNSTQPSNTTSGCCSVKECTTDADCCVQGNECRCSNYDSQGYGSCLNPNKQPASAEGCSAQGKCRNDTHCCKCQCGQVTSIDINGNLGSKKQCVPR